MIILILLLFSGIDILNGQKTTGIDIFERLKSKNITCNLHDFVQSNNNSDDDYKLLIQDLTNYCSNSPLYQLLCHMIYLELEIACLLPNNSRPTPMKYSLDFRTQQICSINKIFLTNDWIWGKLSSDEQQQVGSTPVNLCLKITSSSETLRLVKFFYKIAPRIRRYDSVTTISPNKIDSVVIQSTASLNNTEVNNQTIPDTGNNTNVVSPSSIDLDTNETHNESKKIEPIVVAPVKPQEKKVEINIENNKKKSGEGSPFGRSRDDEEREHINERPKPKVLDVESVFKVNKDEERNWFEGKNFEKQGNNLRIKFDENPLFKSRKRSPIKIKLNRYLDDDDDHANHKDGQVSNNFIKTILVFTLCIVLLYLILHNKNKILGLVIEGCKRRRASNNRRTPTTRRIRLSQTTPQ